MKKLNKVNVSDSFALSFKPRYTDYCASCALPDNSTSGQYTDVHAVMYDEY
ncbi:MAG: hypothetical protein IKN85_04165 [Oscillospiraceae bacterium]|nr:hypothetical protein [Oscillospiraceae bacterium]MBR3535005.1 hypothetical protein [Oscillospiraceae bacterium]MBR6835428.1 hypothetical protein [Oscillospiraceae bacterium]MBR6923106.1 hypothetical protein [Oscillospiraceae bacterium]